MGFFSSKTKIDVFANTSHLSEPTPNALTDAVLYATLSGNPISSSILNVTTAQMSTLVGNFRKYAMESYSLGLPKVSYEAVTEFPEQDVIDAITINTEATYGVVLLFHYVSPMLAEHTVAPYLITTRGWNPTTNDIAIPPEDYLTVNFYNYSWSLQSVAINQEGTIATIEYLVRPYTLERTGTKDTPPAERTYYRNYLPSDVYVDTQSIPNSLNLGRDYCIAAYQVLDSNGTASDITNWWYYDLSSELFPKLILSNSIDETNNLLPVIPIRYENQSMVRPEVQDTDLYKTSKILLRKLNIDITTVAEKLEENPSIGDIDHAYITFGVDLQTEYVDSIRYLAEFFDHISDKAQATVLSNVVSSVTKPDNPFITSGTLNQNTYSFSTGNPIPPSTSTNVVEITNPDGSTSENIVLGNDTLGQFTEFGLDVKITYAYIRSEIIQGSIGKIGHATKEYVLAYRTDLEAYYKNYDESKLILKVQVADNTYKQIIVKGLIHRNFIYGRHCVTTTLTDVIENSEEHNFIIPVHYNLSNKFPPLVRSNIYQDSIVLIMNSVVFTSTKWYTSGFFKFLIMVVGVVISIYTGGAGAWVVGLATAVAEGTIAVLMYLLESIIISMAVSQVLTYVAKWVGPEIMAILSIAVAAIAGYTKVGSLQGVKLAGITMPTASQLMFLATSMLSSTSSAYSGLISDIAKESAIFEAEKEEKLSLLESTLESLTSPTEDVLNLLDAQSYFSTLKQPQTNSPEEFYDLAIHTGNPGTLSLYTIHAFHDLSLTLPKLENQSMV